MNNIERLLLRATTNLTLMELLEESKKEDLVPIYFTYAQLKNLHKWYIAELNKIIREDEKDRERMGSFNNLLEKRSRKASKKPR